MKKFIIAAIAAMSLAVAATPADAYLHLGNAQGYCKAVTYGPAESGFVNGGYGHVLFQLDGGTNTLAYERISDTMVRVLCDNESQTCPHWLAPPACGPPSWRGSQAANFVVGGNDGSEYTVSWYWCYQGMSVSPPGTYWGCPTI